MPPGDSFTEPMAWPKLDAIHLDYGQIEYEVKIRKLDALVHRDANNCLTVDSLRLLNREIQQPPYLPEAVTPSYSWELNSETHHSHLKDEVKICREGANMLKDLSDPNQILHRAIHIFYRLKRLDCSNYVDLEERKGRIYSLVRSHIVDSMTKLHLDLNVEIAQRISLTSPLRLTTSTHSRLTPIVDQPEVSIADNVHSSPLANSTFNQAQLTTTHSQAHTQSKVSFPNHSMPPIYTSYTGTIPKNQPTSSYLSSYDPLPRTHVPGVSYSQNPFTQHSYTQVTYSNPPRMAIPFSGMNNIQYANPVDPLPTFGNLSKQQPLISDTSFPRDPIQTAFTPQSQYHSMGSQAEPNGPAIAVANDELSRRWTEFMRFVREQPNIPQRPTGVDPNHLLLQMEPAISQPQAQRDSKLDDFPRRSEPRPNEFPPNYPLPNYVPSQNESNSNRFQCPTNSHEARIPNEAIPLNYRTNSEHHANASHAQTDMNALKKLQALPRWNIRFSGDKVDDKNQSIEDYIAAVYSFIDSQGVSDHDMINNLLPTLSGAARTWFLTVPKGRLSLRQFMNLLRTRFADKRNNVEVIATLCARQFDSRRGYIIDHIDQLMLDMAYLSLKDDDKLNIVLKTLPDEVRGYVVTARSIDEIKDLCMKIYPPSVKLIPKKEKNDSKPRKVMELECKSESESDHESLDDQDEFSQQLCHLVSKHFSNKKKGKPSEQRPKFREFKSGSKSDPKSELKQTTKSTKVEIDKSKVEGKLATICFNCRVYGHSHDMCTEARSQPFCYKCGFPGVYFGDCQSQSCVEKREQKN